MCRRTTCSQCDKPTFAGCGMHVEQVLGDVPKQERCCCHDKPAKADTTNAAKSASWLSGWLSK